MKLAVLGLSGVLLLTGCASSPSLKEQASLIEYEACLVKQEKIQQEVREVLTRNGIDFEQTLKTIFSSGKPDPKTGLITSLETMIGQCSKYRP
jgi:hypothetical protein